MTVKYTIATENSAAFELGFFQSFDTVFDAADVGFSTVAINDPADLTVGNHTKIYTLGGGVGQLPLPGAGLDDPPIDYFLLGVVDFADAVPEQDATPFAEDNTVNFAGVYHVDNATVMVHGGAAIDNVTAADGASDLVVNGKTFAYTDATITEFRMRVHAGNDIVSGANCSKPLFVWGAAGNDNLGGGSANDSLYAGAGNDTLSGKAGNDYLDGGPGVNTLAGGTGIDTWGFIGAGTNDVVQVTSATHSGTRKVSGVIKQQDNFTDLAANDQVQVLCGAGADAVTITGALRSIQFGEAGNDTLNGGSKLDFMEGGDDNDTLLGNAGNDFLSGGLGDDTVDGGVGSDTIFASPGTDVLKPGPEVNLLLLNSLIPASGTVFLAITLKLQITGVNGGINSVGAGTVQFTGSLNAAAEITGTFTGAANGSSTGVNFSSTFAVNASGNSAGNLTDGIDLDATYAGTEKGKEGGVPFEDDISGNFNGTILMGGALSGTVLDGDPDEMGESIHLEGTGFIISLTTVS